MTADRWMPTVLASSRASSLPQDLCRATPTGFVPGGIHRITRSLWEQSEVTRVAKGPGQSTHLCRPKERIRHRRNLRQLPHGRCRMPPKVLCRAAPKCWVWMANTRSLWEQSEVTRVAKGPGQSTHLCRPKDRIRQRRNLRQLPKVIPGKLPRGSRCGITSAF
jgi:hypothetical protein